MSGVCGTAQTRIIAPVVCSARGGRCPSFLPQKRNGAPGGARGLRGPLGLPLRSGRPRAVVSRTGLRVLPRGARAAHAAGLRSPPPGRCASRRSTPAGCLPAGAQTARPRPGGSRCLTIFLIVESCQATSVDVVLSRRWEQASPAYDAPCRVRALRKANTPVVAPRRKRDALEIAQPQVLGHHSP
jgi:hypothetical protein